MSLGNTSAAMPETAVLSIGTENFFRADKDIHSLFSNKAASWNLSPQQRNHPLKASNSTSHGGFDDDKATVKGTLARIVGSFTSGIAPVDFTASASSPKDRRSGLRASVT